MNSKVIQKRQNEECSLKTQYAARVCFNSAETYNYFVWIACLISAFSIFLPDSWPKCVSHGIAFVFDATAALFAYLASNNVKLASDLRKAFDSYVLGLYTDQSAKNDCDKLKKL